MLDFDWMNVPAQVTLLRASIQFRSRLVLSHIEKIEILGTVKCQVHVPNCKLCVTSLLTFFRVAVMHHLLSGQCHPRTQPPCF